MVTHSLASQCPVSSYGILWSIGRPDGTVLALQSTCHTVSFILSEHCDFGFLTGCKVHKN